MEQLAIVLITVQVIVIIFAVLLPIIVIRHMRAHGRVYKNYLKEKNNRGTLD